MDFEQQAYDILKEAWRIETGGFTDVVAAALQDTYNAGQRAMRQRAATAINERLARVVGYEGTFSELHDPWGRQGAIAALQGALDAIHALEVTND